MTGFQFRRATHSYPLWLLLARLRRGRTCIRPSRPPSFLCISSSPSPTGPGGTRAEGQGIPQVIEKFHEKIMIWLGVFWYVLVFSWPAWEWLGAFVVRESRINTEGASCSSIPWILWVVNRKNDIPSGCHPHGCQFNPHFCCWHPQCCWLNHCLCW